MINDDDDFKCDEIAFKFSALEPILADWRASEQVQQMQAQPHTHTHTPPLHLPAKSSGRQCQPNESLIGTNRRSANTWARNFLPPGQGGSWRGSLGGLID